MYFGDAKYCVSTMRFMKHNIILTKKSKSIHGTVQLTGSKSECNRALIIGALSNGKVKVENISDAADAVTLAGILRAETRDKRLEISGNNAEIHKSEIENPTSEIICRPKRYYSCQHQVTGDQGQAPGLLWLMLKDKQLSIRRRAARCLRAGL